MMCKIGSAPLALSCTFTRAVSAGIVHLPADSFPAFLPNEPLYEIQAKVNGRRYAARRHDGALVHHPLVNHLRTKSLQLSKSVGVRRRPPPLKKPGGAEEERPRADRCLQLTRRRSLQPLYKIGVPHKLPRAESSRHDQ